MALSLSGAIAGFLVMGLVVAIVVEWIGLCWWWREQGVDHARLMLEQELQYLNAEFRHSLFASSPAVFARMLADQAHYWLFEWSGIAGFVAGMQQMPESAGQWGRVSAAIYQVLGPFLLSAVFVTQMYAARIAVLILSLPAVMLFGMVGVAEGLMRRDLRRWGGGRESSLTYGVARATTKPVLMLPWIFYLSAPLALNPTYILVPSAIAFGCSMCAVMATFKKYL